MDKNPKKQRRDGGAVHPAEVRGWTQRMEKVPKVEQHRNRPHDIVNGHCEYSGENRDMSSDY